MTTTDELNERLSRLESQNRRLRLLVGAAWIGIVAVLVAGQSAPTVVDEFEAKFITVRGPRGSVVISDGSVSVSNSSGNIRLWSGFGTGAVGMGPRIALSDSADEERFSVGLDGEKEEPMISLYRKIDKEIKNDREAAARNKDTPKFLSASTRYIRARDSAKAIRVGIFDAAPFVVLNDSDGEPRIQASLGTARGEPTITLLRGIDANALNAFRDSMAIGFSGNKTSAKDGYEQARARAVGVSIGATSNVATKTGLVETRPVNSICLYGLDGKVIWQMP